MKQAIIVGAGMAGLLAGCIFRDRVAHVYEQQPSLPNNHSAVLRFRSDGVGQAIGVDFKAVKVLKGVVAWKNPVADALSYSRKVTGVATARSILQADEAVVQRYISPPDLIQKMYAKVHEGNISFATKLSEAAWKSKDEIVISTIPMPALMKLLGWQCKSIFRRTAGVNISARVADTECYASLYNPDPRTPWARASITGDRVIVECYGEATRLWGKDERWQEDVLIDAVEEMGLAKEAIAKSTITGKQQSYAKILPIDEDARKRFILWATEEFSIYSLGRYATWRPGLLMDDVLQDITVIRRLIDGGTTYPQRIAI